MLLFASNVNGEEMGFWEGLKIAIFGLPRANTIQELRDRDYTPQQLKDYAITHWTYKRDGSIREDWLPPDVAFSRLQKEGDDCDGWAVVFWYVLSKRYLAKLIYVTNGEEAHAACIYQESGKWFYLDNIRRVLYPFKLISDLISDIYSNATYCRYYDWKKDKFVPGEIVWRK